MADTTKAQLRAEVADLRQQVEALRAQLLAATSCWCACGCHHAVVGDWPQPQPQMPWEVPPQIWCTTATIPQWETVSASGAAMATALNSLGRIREMDSTEPAATAD